MGKCRTAVRSNFNISNNGTVANPIGNTLGTVILVATTAIRHVRERENNVIVANNTVGSPGIGGGNGIVSSSAENPFLRMSVDGNQISQTHGNGILLVGRAAGAAALEITNNTVLAPIGGFSHGIRVDAGNSPASTTRSTWKYPATSPLGYRIGAYTAAGIGLRKQGTITTTNDFAIQGWRPRVRPASENYVGGLNPGSADGGSAMAASTACCSFPRRAASPTGLGQAGSLRYSRCWRHPAAWSCIAGG